MLAGRVGNLEVEGRIEEVVVARVVTGAEEVEEIFVEPEEISVAIEGPTDPVPGSPAAAETTVDVPTGSAPTAFPPAPGVPPNDRN